MKRSKSSSIAKPFKPNPRTPTKPPHRDPQMLILDPESAAKDFCQQVSSGPFKTTKSGTCKTARDSVEQRLLNIRKGFEDLQKNLNMYTPDSSIVPSPSRLLTQRKVARKLYKAECKKSKTSKTVGNLHKKRSPQKTSRACPEQYHSCIYQKSLYDLMKIVTMQKVEINKLNDKLKRKNF